MALGAIANKDWHVKRLNRRILLQQVFSKSSSFHCLGSLRHSNVCLVVEADLLERAQSDELGIVPLKSSDKSVGLDRGLGARLAICLQKLK